MLSGALPGKDTMGVWELITQIKKIEVQIMNKFLTHQRISALASESDFGELQDLFKNNMKGSLGETDNSYVVSLMQLAKLENFGTSSFKLNPASNIHITSRTSEVVLSSIDVGNLKSIYQQLYPGKNIFHMSQFTIQFNYWK